MSSQSRIRRLGSPAEASVSSRDFRAEHDTRARAAPVEDRARRAGGGYLTVQSAERFRPRRKSPSTDAVKGLNITLVAGSAVGLDSARRDGLALLGIPCAHQASQKIMRFTPRNVASRLPSGLSAEPVHAGRGNRLLRGG